MMRSHATFYGGTTLRIFPYMERLSKDLDFSFLKPDNNFEPENYLKFVKDELGAFGFDMTVDEKKKQRNHTLNQHLLRVTGSFIF